jgi:putative PIN family toxin of toxin-antitoxin system
MQKVILDTNIIVSALIQRGFSYKIINDLYLNNEFRLCVSNQLLHEYFEVLRRPKFSKFPSFNHQAELILADISVRALKFYPTKTIDIIKDKDDNMIIELADECDADYIVTGNVNDFLISQYKHTLIITPREFYELYTKR